MSIVGRVRRLVLGISERETSFERRGFHTASPRARAELETSGAAFVQGYNAGLESRSETELARRLASIDRTYAGFAFEGAGMALALLDALVPIGGRRLQRFLRGAGEPHSYMVAVGAGWAWSRLRRNLDREMQRLDPMLRWLAVDGAAFHDCFFAAQRFVNGTRPGPRYPGYARRVHGHGVGRCLWFACGADTTEIARVVRCYEPSAHPDLWSGVGLACTYAGGVDASDIERLASTAAPYSVQLAQGAAFAAKARQRAGNLLPHTDTACRILCGMSAEEAARVTDTTLADLPPDGDEPAYEVWRRRIQIHFAVRPRTAEARA